MSLLQVDMDINATAKAVVEHGQHITVPCDRISDLDARRPHDKAATPIPNIVITGIGDSGTRGMKLMLQHLGVSMCGWWDRPAGAGDNKLTMPTHLYIKDLLRAAHGSVNSRAGYMQSNSFNEAVHAERSGAQNTLDCIIEDMDFMNASLPIGFKWGYKNPRHAYLMPVMDVAFHNKHKVLMVARDPRDLCTGSKEDFGGLWQLEKYGSIVLGERDDQSLEQCMRFLASVWAPVLQDYGHDDNLLIVRIEDLVMPDPTASNTSQQMLKRIMEYAADISPSIEQLQEELKESHSHADSYMGHHQGMTLAEKEAVEIQTASYKGEVHDMMKALGYQTDHYGLIDPSHPRVLSLAAFL